MTDSDLEERLWQRLREEAKAVDGGTVRIAQIACDELPMHKEQATNIIAHWRNRGLVETHQSDCRARLTERGWTVETP